MAKKLTNEDVSETLKPRGIVLIGEYRGKNNKSKYRCNKCYHEWSGLGGNVIDGGTGCPKCAGVIKYTKITIDLLLNDQNITLLGEYKNNKTYTVFKCTVCDHTWSSRLVDVKRGNGCRKCANKKLQLSLTEVSSRLANRNIQLVSEYHGMNNQCVFECTLCNNRWSARASHVISHTGCPVCQRKSRKLTSEIVNLRLMERPIRLIGEYTDAITKTLFKCRICEYTWMAKPYTVLSETNCPKCSKTGFNPALSAKLYVINISGMYCGYGITNNLKNRLDDHKRSCRKLGHDFKIVSIFDFSGIEAEIVERLIKNSVDSIDTGIRGFRKEATIISNLPLVLNIINNCQNANKSLPTPNNPQQSATSFREN